MGLSTDTVFPKTSSLINITLEAVFPNLARIQTRSNETLSRVKVV